MSKNDEKISIIESALSEIAFEHDLTVFDDGEAALAFLKKLQEKGLQVVKFNARQAFPFVVEK